MYTIHPARIPAFRSVILITSVAASMVASQVVLAQPDSVENTPAVGLSEPITELSENNNEAAAGEAGDWRGPSEFVRSHWVRLTADGRLQGRIVTINPQGTAGGLNSLEVEVFQNGESLAETTTNPDGSFTMEGLQPGVYALIARGDNGFLAYGLQLLPSLRQARRDNVHFAQAPQAKAALEITSAAVPPTFKQLKKILDEKYPEMRSHYVPEEAFRPFLEAAREPAQPGEDPEVDSDASERKSIQGNAELSAGPERPEKAFGATSVDVHPVYLTKDNVLHGRLYGIDASTGRPRNINRTTVYVIRNDRLVTSAEVNAKGFFKVTLRRPTVYSLIVAGEDGFGAVSFRAIKRDADQEARHRSLNDSVYFVRAQLGEDDSLAPEFDGTGNTVSAPFAMALIDDPRVIAQAVVPRRFRAGPPTPLAATGLIGPTPPMAPGGLGAPATMGGAAQSGFTGSGGGLAAVAGFGGLAAGITALAVDNNSRVRVVSPFDVPLTPTPLPPPLDPTQ